MAIEVLRFTLSEITGKISACPGNMSGPKAGYRNLATPGSKKQEATDVFLLYEIPSFSVLSEAVFGMLIYTDALV